MKYGSGLNLEPSATPSYADDYADDSSQCNVPHVTSLGDGVVANAVRLALYVTTALCWQS
jgi:hypothetical protein